MAHSGPLLSFSFQCADFVLHTDNTPNACYPFTLQCRNFLVFLTALVASDVFVCVGLRLRFLVFLFVCCLLCGSRYALLAWGSALRLFAV